MDQQLHQVTLLITVIMVVKVQLIIMPGQVVIGMLNQEEEEGQDNLVLILNMLIIVIVMILAVVGMVLN